MVGVLNTTFPYTLYAIASTHGVDVSVMAILSAVSPVFAAVLAQTFVPGSEPICQPKRLTGLLLALFGSLLVALRKDFLRSGSHSMMSRTSAEGVVAQLLAVLCKSSAAVLAEQTFKFGGAATALQVSLSSPPSQSALQTSGGMNVTSQPSSATHLRAPSVAMTQACCGAAVAIPIAWLWDFVIDPSRGGRFWERLGGNNDDGDDDDDESLNLAEVLPALLYLGLASSCLVYFLQFFVIQRAGGVRQIVGVDCLTPAVGVAEGAIFLCDFCGDSASSVAMAVCGASLCVVGVGLFHWDSLAPSAEGSSWQMSHFSRGNKSSFEDRQSDEDANSDGDFGDPFGPSKAEAALVNPLLETGNS